MPANTRFVMTASDQTRAAIASAERNFKRLDTVVGGLGGTLKLLGATAGVGGLSAFGLELVRQADNVRLLKARLDALGAGGTGFENIVRVATETSSSLDDVANIFTKFQIAGQSVGLAQSKVTDLTETLIKLGQIGGSSPEALKNGLIQFSQALAGGKLRAEEFNSLIENTPLVVTEIARALNKSQGELRAMVVAGEAGTDVLTSILTRSESIDERYAKLPQTFERSMAQVKTEWTLTMSALDKTLEVSGTYQFFSEGFASFLRKTRLLLGDTEDITVARARNNELLARELEITEQLVGLEERRDEANSGRARNALSRQIRELRAELESLRAERAQLQEQFKAKAVQASEEEAAVTINPPADKTDTENKLKAFVATLSVADEPIEVVFDAKTGTVDIEATVDRAYKKAEDRGREYTAFERDYAERRNKAAEEEADRKVRADEKAAREAKKKLDELQVYSEQAARNMQDALADAIFNSFDDGVKGMLKTWADALLKMEAQALAAHIFESTGLGAFISSGFGLFAEGGKVRAGEPIVAGERGPELYVSQEAAPMILGARGRQVFVPPADGEIISHRDLQTAHTRAAELAAVTASIPRGVAALPHFAEGTTRLVLDDRVRDEATTPIENRVVHVNVDQYVDARGNDRPQDILAFAPLLAEQIEREIRDKMRRGIF